MPMALEPIGSRLVSTLLAETNFPPATALDDSSIGVVIRPLDVAPVAPLAPLAPLEAEPEPPLDAVDVLLVLVELVLLLLLVGGLSSVPPQAARNAAAAAAAPVRVSTRLRSILCRVTLCQ